MNPRSWLELAGRNLAAGSTPLTGSVKASTSSSEYAQFDFRYAPGGKWRIERDGEPVYIASGESAVVRIGDQMQQLDGDFRLPRLGAQFSPLDLFGARSLIQKMSAELTTDGPTIQLSIDGRVSWSVLLIAPEREPIGLTFDDASGVLVQVVNAEGMVLLQVDNLAETDLPPDSLFTWKGQVRRDRSPRAQLQNDEESRVEFMRAIVAAQARPQDVLTAIAGSDSENAAAAALIELLDVTEFGANSILATPIGQFRSDHATSNRRTLAAMENRHQPDLDIVPEL